MRFNGNPGGLTGSRGGSQDSTELMNVLRAAVESMKDEHGFAAMTRIGQYISNHSSLSSKNYGYAKWSDLIRATEYFEESSDENHQVAFGSRKAKAAPAQAE